MILILTQCFPPDRGGIENLMGGLAQALHDAGQHVFVLADHVRKAEEHQTFAFPVQRFSGPRPWRRWRKRGAATQLMQPTPTSGQPSAVRAVIADSWKSLDAMPPVNVPVLVLAHGMEFPADASAIKKQRIRTALARATTIIANSVYTAGLVRPYMGVGSALEIIHPPIGPQPEPDVSAKAAVAGMVEGRTPILLTVARLEPRKGIDQVIRALPALLEHHPALLYCVAGGGPGRDRLEQLAEDLGVDDYVRFCGPVSAEIKSALLARADLFVMPTRREGNSVEGFGISYIEAAWYGVPSVAGGEGGGVDAVLHNETGRVCDGGNVNAVTGTIMSLLRDNNLRARLGRAAAKRARGELQWPHAVRRYLALIERNQGRR